MSIKEMQQRREVRHLAKAQEPHRVAPRLEGVVRKRGIKPKKKTSKHSTE